MNLFPARFLTGLVLLTVLAAAHAQPDRQPTGVSPGIPASAGPAMPAPRIIAESQRASLASSNLFRLGVNASRVPERAIQPVPGGGRADFGLLKTFFPVDVKDGRVVITTPDGRLLAFRPTFLALRDVASGQSLLLATITNRVGAIVAPDAVAYTNAFDTLQATIRYRRLANGAGLEQDVALLESFEVPSGWSADSLRLEIWTAWYDSEPVSKTTYPMDLRGADASGLLAPSLADNDRLDFGTAKIVDGFAFGSTTQNERIPVNKSWVRIEGLDWLIESVDFLAVKPQLDLLPKGRRTADLNRKSGTREEMIRSLAQTSPPRPGNQARLLMAKATPSRQPEFVMDFIIVSSVPVPPSAVSWWPAGGNADDAIGSNDGTLYNGGTYAAGQVGQSFKLDGNNDHVRIPNQPNLRFTNALTFEGWVYPTNTSYYCEILSKWDAVGGYDQRSFDCSLYPGGRFYILVSPGGTDSGAAFVLTTNTVPVNTWTHVGATYDGSTLKVYFNGVLEAEGAYSNGIYPGTNSLGIGAATGGASPGGMLTPFPGLIDEPTLYARGLGASEIWAIYNAGAAGKHNPNCATPDANIVAWWPGDGNTYDLARTNFATLNGATYQSAVVAQGFSFDGTDDGVSVAHNSALDFAAAEDFTLEAWIQAFENETDYNVMSIMGKRHAPDGSSAIGYELFLIEGALGLQLADSTGTIVNFIDWSTDLREDGWHHVAVTVERETEDGGWLYVDGQPVMQFDPTDVPGDLSNTDPFRIGVHPLAGFNGFYKGAIDEPTVYRAALSSSQISALYAAGTAGKCKVDTDGDGLTDLQESFLGTNPNDTDSDDDGFTDGDEVFVHRTKPNNQDSDGDGVIDQAFKVIITRPAGPTLIP